jgi:hypothetical protein
MRDLSVYVVGIKCAMRMQTEVAVSNSSEAKARAEASFKRKEEQVREGANAWTEYQVQFRGVDEKIARLKVLRLAKEAAEAAAKGKKETRAPKSSRSRWNRNPRKALSPDLQPQTERGAIGN